MAKTKADSPTDSQKEVTEENPAVSSLESGETAEGTEEGQAESIESLKKRINDLTRLFNQEQSEREKLEEEQVKTLEELDNYRDRFLSEDEKKEAKVKSLEEERDKAKEELKGRLLDLAKERALRKYPNALPELLGGGTEEEILESARKSQERYLAIKEEGRQEAASGETGIGGGSPPAPRTPEEEATEKEKEAKKRGDIHGVLSSRLKRIGL